MKRLTIEDVRREHALRELIREMDPEDVKLLGRLVDLLHTAPDAAVADLGAIAKQGHLSLRERLDAAVARLERQPPADTEPDHEV